MSQLTAVELEIPPRSGDVLCTPAGTDFLAVAAANAQLLAASRARLCGVPLIDLRRSARRRVLADAAAYTRALGLSIDAATMSPTLPLIGTGHQPFLFHPGIWTKHLLADRFVGRAAVVNMPVDCDAAEDVGCDAPHLDGGLRIVREVLLRVDPDVPYEATPAPSHWSRFLQALDDHLQTLPHRGTHDVFAAFRAATADLDVTDLGSFLTLARRRYEGPTRYAELPVSHLAATEEFRLFALHVFKDAERFAESYNAHLDAYRERYNVRTTAQPFPNLEREGARVEVPFWILRDGRRRPCFVERRASVLRLWAGEEAVAEVGDEAGELAAVHIRPKALALTAFSRLCVVDLFVHGVGGGRYDRVTDAVIADFFGLTPPRYAVVTATLHLPLSEFDPSDERAALQRRLLELRHNPERVVSNTTPGQQRMVEEKWRLIRRLDNPTLTRRERREATHRIREINEALGSVLEAERRTLEHRLASLDEISRASEAATHREYPFCFFPVQAVEGLVDRILGNGLDD